MRTKLSNEVPEYCMVIRGKVDSVRVETDRPATRQEVDRSRWESILVGIPQGLNPVQDLIPLLSRRVVEKNFAKLEEVMTWVWYRHRDTIVVVLFGNARVRGMGFAVRGSLDRMDETVGIATAASRALDSW